ncbi:uncharacterized protein K441DRAFT_660403 [Cenococcum geophilum 1.58]|uniref:uncharacterized protein n=1 Tax=Cenococcum geophilum 1.58 TaxID=794803 RepID=UPI0035901344|nr:hypothetical protein K441DRAFT_660403 [Cenococcum geophilum 1.58]
MKFSILSLGLLGLVSFAYSAAIKPAVVKRDTKLHFEVQFSDKLIDVGNLNSFDAVWQRMYAQSNDHAGLSDATYYQFDSACNHKFDKPQLNVNVKLDGQWGNFGDFNNWDMRNAVIKTMWAAVDNLGKQQSRLIFSKCYGTVWQEIVAYTENAACGRLAAIKDCQCDILAAQCMQVDNGFMLPSIIKVLVYQSDGVLRPDNYIVTLSSHKATSQGGCGKAGALAEVLASFIPGIGTFVEKGIKVTCRQ